jgi:glycosyltransferase involved in cell wall biosynthesis
MDATGRPVVMVTSSYPRYPGDAIATFMEPIAQGVAALGHPVHVVAPWHPEWRRPLADGRLSFHLYRYAPTSRLCVFGYAGALREDVRLRASAMAVAPLAMAAGVWKSRQIVRDTGAVLVHAHWVIPGGVQAAAAAGRRPLVISLHGSDVFVAERHRVAAMAARAAFRRAAWVTACSADLQRRAIALGAPPDRMTVVPYGVASDLFRPDPDARARSRAQLGVDPRAPLVLAFGRLVRKKGFEYLIDAAATLRRTRPDLPGIVVAIAGEGDLGRALRGRAVEAGIGDLVRFPGVVPHQEMPALIAAADVAVVPSIRDEAGNVDGLPNTVLEIMASATPLVATPAGGIAAVATDGLTARIVPERDAEALAGAITSLLADPVGAADIGRNARELVCRDFSWAHAAREFERVYDRVLTRSEVDGG